MQVIRNWANFNFSIFLEISSFDILLFYSESMDLTISYWSQDKFYTKYSHEFTYQP